MSAEHQYQEFSAGIWLPKIVYEVARNNPVMCEIFNLHYCISIDMELFSTDTVVKHVLLLCYFVSLAPDFFQCD